MTVSSFVHGAGDVATSRIAKEQFHRGSQPDEEFAAQLERSRSAGVHIPEPIHETFELDRPALAVLRWSNAGVDDEERFAFRSVWLAWKAARKLTGAGREA